MEICTLIVDFIIDSLQSESCMSMYAFSVLCHVYVTGDSYVSVRTHSKVTAQELLAAVAERLECAEDGMVLVAVTYSRGTNLQHKTATLTISSQFT